MKRELTVFVLGMIIMISMTLPMSYVLDSVGVHGNVRSVIVMVVSFIISVPIFDTLRRKLPSK